MNIVTREFLVNGSEPLPYKVVFLKNGRHLMATCSCKAGAMGMLCKHRLAILDGNRSAVVSDNSDQVVEVASWLPDSSVGEAISELVSLEDQKKKIEAKIKRAKKVVADALLPRRSGS